MKLKHLDLFSGIGGFSLGLEATGGFETMAFCDIEEYPRQVLQKHWPHVKQYKDIKELNYERLKADGIDSIDIITGGYPCQPFSVAGRKKGEEDPRHLWPEYFRLVKELRPTWVIGENVGGHIKLGLDTVIQDLESEDYSVRPFSISASSIGANHQRERIWILAYSERNGFLASEKQRSFEKTIPNQSKGKNDTLNVERTSSVSETKSDVENSRRSQWPRAELREENENETRKENANQFERSSSTSEVDVANTESISSDGREDREYSKEGNTKREVGGVSSNVANTTSERRQRFSSETNMERKSSTKPSERGNEEISKNVAYSERIGQQRQRQSFGSSNSKKNKTWETGWSYDGSQGAEGWWESEPNVGRVAHGIPKRVDRLKSLGNSLVPQIPYYIGCSILGSIDVANTTSEVSQLSKKTRDDGEDR
jgi:DNA (cytosine-5)-methyltransferase 1